MDWAKHAGDNTSLPKRPKTLAGLQHNINQYLIKQKTKSLHETKLN
jgi:hypothetical protein